RLVRGQVDTRLQPLAGGQRLLRQRVGARVVVGERFVAEHLLLGVGQRLLVVRPLDDLDLGVAQPIELVDDLVDERVGAGKLLLDGQERGQRGLECVLDLALDLLQRNVEAPAILVQPVVEVGPRARRLALLIVAQIVLQDRLAGEAVDARGAVLGDDREPAFQPAGAALTFSSACARAGFGADWRDRCSHRRPHSG
ncbi:MAG TPA: hypothetical protein PL187_17030, partial [Caldilinea sp.]|nr:hypothetical protein [Caldilinea sp.]